MSAAIDFKVSIPTAAVHRYADISGDHNPLHLNDTFAKQAGFSGAIVHGMFTLAMVYEGIFAHLQGQQHLHSMAVRFREPLYPGDTLCVRGTQDDETFLVTTATGRALFKDFKARWALTPKTPLPNVSLPTLQEQFATESLGLNPRNVTAYQELLASLLPQYRTDSPPIFLMAQTFIVQLLKHLESLRPLQSQRILHLAQDLTIFGALPRTQSFALNGGITQQSHKMGQDFIHFFQILSSDDQTFQMVGKGFGMVQPIS